MAKRPLPSFMVFRDKDGNWRWNFAGPGGRIIAASTQAYKQSAGCIRAIQILKGSAQIPVVGRPVDVNAAREARGEAAVPAAKRGQTRKKPESAGAEAAEAPTAE